jgi:hypothetical protein
MLLEEEAARQRAERSLKATREELAQLKAALYTEPPRPFDSLSTHRPPPPATARPPRPNPASEAPRNHTERQDDAAAGLSDMMWSPEAAALDTEDAVDTDSSGVSPSIVFSFSGSPPRQVGYPTRPPPPVTSAPGALSVGSSVTLTLTHVLLGCGHSERSPHLSPRPPRPRVSLLRPLRRRPRRRRRLRLMPGASCRSLLRTRDARLANRPARRLRPERSRPCLPRVLRRRRRRQRSPRGCHHRSCRMPRGRRRLRRSRARCRRWRTRRSRGPGRAGSSVHAPLWASSWLSNRRSRPPPTAPNQ